MAHFHFAFVIKKTPNYILSGGLQCSFEAEGNIFILHKRRIKNMKITIERMENVLFHKAKRLHLRKTK